MVFVVTYQAYIYPDDAGEEVKYLLNENFDVKGVFSTLKKAEDYIKEDLKKDAVDMCGDDRKEIKEFIKKYRNNYSLYDFEVDKPQNN